MKNNVFRLENFETNEKVTVRLYDDCMDIIDKDGFITTIARDTIVDANMERETHSETKDYGKVRVGARVVPGVYVSRSVDVKNTNSYTIVKLRIKSVIDDLVLFGSEEQLRDILYYCVSKRRNLNKKEIRGYYAWNVVGYITLAAWIGSAFMLMYYTCNFDTHKEFEETIAYTINLWFGAIAFLGLIPTYLLGFVYKDSKPEVEYPKRNN